MLEPKVILKKEQSFVFSHPHHLRNKRVLTQTKAAKLQVYPDAYTQMIEVAARWVALADEAIAERGAFHVALSGGSTPAHLYERLAHPDTIQQVDWPRIHVFWGDERSVPLDHPESNYRLAFERWLSRVPIPGDHVHPITARPDTIHGDARRYATLLCSLLPANADGMPVLDLVLLGLGEDGHIASLFPDTPILQEQREPVTAVFVERLKTWRVSLTFPTLNAARHILVLVSGERKADVVRRVFVEPPMGPRLPVQMLAPQGTIEWHLDRAAAGYLPEYPEYLI
jgi:6-phosphogluconolactonase